MQVQRSSNVMPTLQPVASRVQAGGGEAVAVPQPQQMTANSDLAMMSRIIENPQDLGGLNRWGLASPGMLRFAAGGSIRRAIASFLTGVPTDRLIVYGQMADMMRINGMQPDWANLLVNSGIPSPAELSRYSGSDIAATVQRGILLGTLTAKSLEKAMTYGRAYSVPDFSTLGLLAQNAIGLGSSININSTMPASQAVTQPAR